MFLFSDIKKKAYLKQTYEVYKSRRTVNANILKPVNTFQRNIGEKTSDYASPAPSILIPPAIG